MKKLSPIFLTVSILLSIFATSEVFAAGICSPAFISLVDPSPQGDVLDVMTNAPQSSILFMCKEDSGAITFFESMQVCEQTCGM